MTLHRRDIPLLGFLNECNKTPLDKVILDCGAGGSSPPLAIFYEQGYECHGIELSERQIEKANIFEKENAMSLNIVKGDIRNLPYDDGSFSFVFSHHTVFHMSKKDIEKSVNEMKRVLAPHGLLFINFAPIDRLDYGKGEEVGKGEFLQPHGDEDIIHAFYEDNEADIYFKNFDMIHKQKWFLLKSEHWSDGITMLEYIVRKKK